LSTEEIETAEREIDEAFAESELINLGYSQAVWTLLSVVEDHHFKIRVYNPLEEEQQDIYVDGLLNALTYPLQVCHKTFPLRKTRINRTLIDSDYEATNKWIDKAEDYTHFCSIFPLFHNGEIDLKISGKNITPTDWTKYDLSYEVYDRFIKKRHPEVEEPSDPNTVAMSVRSQTSIKKDSFRLNFSPQLVKELKDHLKKTHQLRFSLPDDWEFQYFSIQDFKEVFTTLQSMSYGWFMARKFACAEGIPALGFKDSLWRTPAKRELIARLRRYTGITAEKIEKIVEYLTFGEAGIRNPDIAIQPIVDLRNGDLAISTFVFLNVNCERNLCVLLNQIKKERKIYSGLVKDKENKIRDEIIDRIKSAGYETRYGELDDTDVDLAIIDRDLKKCITIELKWFIEPAEIREVIQRSKEVKKGVEQAKKITDSWRINDKRLVDDILSVDDSFDFLAVVAPVTSIGNPSSQDTNIPVIKTWHLIDEILRIGDLGKVMVWLKNRDYLPRMDVDFKIEQVDIKSGEWSSIWYGITHA
jgi:hypothetical protein